MSAADCVFCRILAGQIPALRVFENEDILAFLDIGPLAEGHCLVIPKKHHVLLSDMSDDEVAAVTRHLPRLTRAVMKGVGVEGCNVLVNVGRVASQEVPHVHWHVIPRRPADGLGYRWDASKYPPGRGEQVAAQVAAALKP
ncbi:MAG TPA: HIT family protein [Phycisphaerae bacterium]|nr:HIT family protein [Phycisphaerae bacterium]